MKDMTKLLDYRGEDRIITSHEMSERIKNHKDGYIVPSGILGLDKYMNGFESGELIAVSGPTKSGKTLLCQTITDFLVKKEYTPLWFSYELTDRQFLRCFPELPKFVMPAKLKPAQTNWLEERIAEAIAKYEGMVIVFIDHFHFLFDMVKDNASLSMGAVVRKLKTIAIDYDIAIVLLCHMLGIDEDKEPSWQHIRDCKIIPLESDTTLLIWRKPNSDNEATIKLDLCRRTGFRDKYVNLIKVDSFLREKANVSENGNGLHEEIKEQWYQEDKF